MSQLLSPTHTLVDKIPLGRRIAETMHEKGAVYTISAMAKRLELNRETLRLMLKGEREIYTFELEKIARDLKMPVERILQSDVVEERERLNNLLRTPELAQQAIELSDELVCRANGLTELCNTLNQKARCHYIIGKNEEAHKFWLQALPLARLVQEKYSDPAALVKIVSNLTLTYSLRNDHVAIFESVKSIEHYLEIYPEQAVVAYGVMATTAFHRGDFEEARKLSYQWLQLAERTNNSRIFVRAVTNTATIEYFMQNYLKANFLYENAVDRFVDAVDPFYISLHYQEYAKTLYRLKRLEQAKEMLSIAEKYLKLITIQFDPIVESQHCFLKAIIKQDTYDLEQIVCKSHINESLRNIFCIFLSGHYDRQGNYILKEKYETMSKSRYLAINKLLVGITFDSDTLLNIYEFFCSIGWHKDTPNH